MECTSITLSRHANERMKQRQIGYHDVVAVVRSGQVIDETVDDGSPVVLLLGFPGGRALHVVVARVPGPMDCMVVTAYDPSPFKWTADFRRRRA